MKKIFALFVALCVLFPATAAFAQADYVLQLGTLASKDSPWGKQLKLYKKTIQKESDGRIRVKVLWSGKGNDEVAMMRMLKRGDLQGFGGSTGAIATQVPEMAIFELCYAFDSLKEADRIIDEHLTDPVRQILSEEGFVLYAMGENGFRNFATTGREIHGPSDLEGIKMRSQEQWAHEEAYRALGGNPVPLAVSEVPMQLTNGGVLGFDNTALFAQVTGWYKHVDTWTVSNHIYQPAMIIYNKTWYDSLPADLQQILMMNAQEQTVLGRKLVRQMQDKLMENLVAADIKIYTPTADEMKAMRDTCRPKLEKVYLEKIENKDRANLLLKTLRDAR